MKYRQTVIVELEGTTIESVFTARIKLEKHLVNLSIELGRLKETAHILIIPDKEIREYDPTVMVKPRG
jgi:hypothetical protein